MDAPLSAEYWELVERYREGLVEQALSILGNRADAEDAVQETFVEAARNPGSSRRRSRWARGWERSTAPTRSTGSVPTSAPATARACARRELPEDAFTTGGFSALELRESMARAIESLSPKLREAVELRFWRRSLIQRDRQGIEH